MKNTTKTGIGSAAVLSIGVVAAVVGTASDPAPGLMQATVLVAVPIQEAAADLVETDIVRIRPTPGGIVTQTQDIITSQGLCTDINNALKTDPSHPDPCTPATVDYRRQHTRTNGATLTQLELCVRVIIRGKLATSGGRTERRCFVWTRSPTPPGLASQILTQLTNTMCPSADTRFGTGACDPASVPYDIRHNRRNMQSRSIGKTFIETVQITEPAPEPTPP